MPGGLYLALQQRCQISTIWLFIELYVCLKYRQGFRAGIIAEAKVNIMCDCTGLTSRYCGKIIGPWALWDSDDCNLVNDQSVSSSPLPDYYVYPCLYDYCFDYRLGKKRRDSLTVWYFSVASLEVTPSVWHLRTFPRSWLLACLLVSKMCVYLCCPKLLRKDLLHNCCYR